VATGDRARAVTAVLAVLLGSAGLPSPGGDVAQAEGPSQAVDSRFKATTDLVQVDVGVFDEQGRPVRDLDAGDFVVEEDGVAQRIEGVQSVAASEGASSEPWLASRVSTNLGAKSANAPTLVVVLDDIHLSERGAARARAAAARLLEGLGQGSQVGVVSTGGGIWCSGRIERDREGLMSAIQRLTGQRLAELRGADQITDYEAMRIAQHNDTVVLRRVVDRWTRNSRLWEQTWGADTAPGGATGTTDAALRAPGSRASGDIRTALGSSSGETQAVQALATQAFETARQGRQRTYRSLLRILTALGATEGRKSVVFLSESFLNDSSDPEFALVTSASRRANAPIHVIDVGGLAASDLQADQRRIEDVGPTLEEQQEMRARLAGIAAECGGFAITGTDDLAEALERLVTESSRYYLLGYQPTNRVADGTYRRIRVAVRRSGVQVRARPGYVALPPEAAAGGGRQDPARRMREAADAPFALAGIDLRMSAYTFDTTRERTTRTLLVSELRLDDLSFVEADGQFSAELDVLLTVTHFETGRTLGDRPVGIKLAARSDVRGQAAWHRITQEVQLQPGAWLAKIVVRDRRSGAVGSVTHSLDVPGGAGWRASSAVISDALSADSGPERQHALPLARRTFAAAGMLYAELELYDAILDESTGRPRISAGFVLVRSGGAVERQGALAPVEPLHDRTLTHFIALPLRGLKPGDYELVLRLEDKVTGRTRELHEPFSLRRPERPTLAFYRDLLQDYVEGRGEDAVAILVSWPPSAGAGLAKRIDSSEGMPTRVAAMLHTEAAMALYASRETGDAPAHLETARAVLERTEPDSSFRRDWLLAVGFQLQARGDRASEALRFFLECQSAFPHAAEARLAAGTVYEASAFPNGIGGNRVAGATGDLVEAAKRQYRAALAIDPLLAEAGLRLGRTLQLAGDREEALAQLRRVADQDGGGSTQALAHLFLGELLEQRGEDEEAARQFREALEQDATLQQAGLALAATLWRGGDRTGSAQVLGAAFRGGCPVGPPSWLAYHLGVGVRAASAIDALRRAARS
jgi:VWFA-related protein